jgi:hypothetical protein
LLQVSIKEINSQVSFRIGLRRWGDATQLRQIIMNLIVNTSEARDHSVISVTQAPCIATRTISKDVMGLFINRLYVSLEVSDFGMWHRPKFLPHFGPYSTKFTGRGPVAAVIGILRVKGNQKWHTNWAKVPRSNYISPPTNKHARYSPPRRVGAIGQFWDCAVRDDEEAVALGQRMLEKQDSPCSPRAMA